MDCARGPRLDDLDIYHHIFVGKGLNNFNFYLFLLFSIFKLAIARFVSQVIKIHQ